MGVSKSTLFGLFRHGQTVWSTQRRLQGRLDSPLTDEGIEAVREWARFLAGPRWNWARIITSPAPRARTTAQLINDALRVEIQEEQDLREQNWGIWEGLSWTEILTNSGDEVQTQVEKGWAFRPPDGESRGSKTGPSTSTAATVPATVSATNRRPPRAKTAWTPSSEVA